MSAIAFHPPLPAIPTKLRHLDGSLQRFARTVPVCKEIDRFLPNHGLPLGCIHAIDGESLVTSIAFASLLSARISQVAKSHVLYIAPDRSLYPLGLLPYGVNLDSWIHICVPRSGDLAWTILEALRCSQASAVIAIVKAADLTFCRRLQLAAESSGATGFLLGHAASALTKWEISTLQAPSQAGFDEAFWDLKLVYSRGGRPGQWNIAVRESALSVYVPGASNRH